MYSLFTWGSSCPLLWVRGDKKANLEVCRCHQTDTLFGRKRSSWGLILHCSLKVKKILEVVQEGVSRACQGCSQRLTGLGDSIVNPEIGFFLETSFDPKAILENGSVGDHWVCKSVLHPDCVLNLMHQASIVEYNLIVFSGNNHCVAHLLDFSVKFFDGHPVHKVSVSNIFLSSFPGLCKLWMFIPVVQECIKHVNHVDNPSLQVSTKINTSMVR